MALLREHHGQLIADFRRFYGASLLAVREAGWTVGEVAACAANLPPESAIVRAADPHWWVTPEVSFLRLVERQLRVLEWRQTKDGQANPPRNRPEVLPLDKDEEREQREARGELVSDVMSKDDMARLIGWDN